MLLNLVKKDFVLAKKYLLVSFIFTVGIPLFITTKINFNTGGFLEFFITVIYIEYMLFNTVSMSEDKYKGSALLCTTPYTRNRLVKAKYLFILVIFLSIYIIYTITAILAPLSIANLSIVTVGRVLLITSIFWGILIPIQYQFGYEKTKYIGFCFIFISPFVVPYIITCLQSNNISLNLTLPFPQILQDLLPYLIALVFGYISMLISIHIYSKKNL
ncbi:ABC-2 transporter permease [Oceanirhabdus sp. W0125-5]|uniref:ABC-2 transporter permease n=1 Tax=Oceanirhabdus sp. W0125-5 TaxID=2999116 RepID=UPI0022F3359A|nr:ABC-2 transporter permease [Oceanirhabdus sp. W0125-5]WBW95782.1 ABC-2 transporter permease [Oceanirhabdus sp. W0125-5]